MGDTCVVCGEYVVEGTMVCHKCEQESKEKSFSYCCEQLKNDSTIFKGIYGFYISTHDDFREIKQCPYCDTKF